MKKIALTLSASALMLVGSLSGLSAHQISGPMMQGGGPGGAMMGPGTAGPGNRAPGGWGPEMMMGGGMAGFGMMMGAGMMGHGMSHMMLIMMDTDGDGALSLEEYQAVHARAFQAMDIDNDGKLTPDEMEFFMEGERTAPDDDR